MVKMATESLIVASLKRRGFLLLTAIPVLSTEVLRVCLFVCLFYGLVGFFLNWKNEGLNEESDC